MRSDRACRNGLAPKAGSSAIEILSATKLREKTEKRKFPRVTLRPRAAESCVSSVTRKVLALTNNGTTRPTINIKAATPIRMLIQGCFFNEIPPYHLQDGFRRLLDAVNSSPGARDLQCARGGLSRTSCG